MEVKIEELVSALRWKLNLPVDQGDPNRYAQICTTLLQGKSPREQRQIDQICRFLGTALECAIRHRLGLVNPAETSADPDLYRSLWKAIEDWVKADPLKRSPRLSGWLREAIKADSPPPAPAAGRPPVPRTQPVRSAPPVPPPPRSVAAPPGPAPAAPLPPPQPARSSPADDLVLDVIPVDPPSAPLPDMNANPSSRPTGPQWQYKPLPQDGPDLFPEFSQAILRTPEDWRLVAARVRGKKHKHEGTNCDDWFAVCTAGRWSISAVSDGAGSKRLSRVGARALCESASALLARQLEGVQIQAPAAQPEQIQQIQEGLHQAVREAFQALEREAAARAGKEPYQKLLGRPVVLEDLSATLLLAVHTSYATPEGLQSFVMTYQIGDGAVAVIERGNRIVLLGQADQGEFSGETDFLTSPKHLHPEGLRPRTFQFEGPLRALLVMTDGVADDYFPPEPGMLRLLTDLILNGILPCPAAAPAEGERLPFEAGDGRLDREVEIATAEGFRRCRLRSAELLADQVGRSIPELAGVAGLLAQAAQGSPLAVELDSPELRLRTWLDCYQVRGSFDDRTLVVLDSDPAS